MYKSLFLLLVSAFFFSFVKPDNKFSVEKGLILTSDTIEYKGHKFLFDFGNKPNSKYKVVIENMNIILYSNGVASDIVVSSFVAETKVKSVLVSYPTQGSYLVSEKLLVNAKGNIVYISEITGKTKDGKTINRIVPGFKITVL